MHFLLLFRFWLPVLVPVRTYITRSDCIKSSLVVIISVTYIIGHALNFATRSRFKVGWRHLGLATTPRTGAPGLETARNYVVGKPVPHVTAETFQFKNWATFGFQRYSWLRLNFRQRRIHYTRDQPQKLDSRRHDIRTTGWPASRGLEGQLVVRFRPFRLRFELRAK
eukprot:COSAG06_NODE_3769_length_4925_cov_76.558433_6_plen_167_part_00